MRGPLDVSRELLALNVAHEIVHLRRRIVAATGLAEALGVSPAHCVVTELFESSLGPVAVLRPIDVTVSTESLELVTGLSGVRRAGSDVVSDLTDYNAALVAPVGLPASIRSYADSSLGRADVVYTATGDGGTALKIRIGDLLAVTGALVATVANVPGLVTEVPAQIDWRAVESVR